MKVTFTDGTAFYFVVPSLSHYGNVIVEIKRKGTEYIVSHACSENACNENVLCDHNRHANVFIKSWNIDYESIVIHYKNKQIQLQSHWIQI
ncbi:hypothetical protein M3589_24120 [Heyndrickxia oleronia]|uniref:hypothetical protein n=1 Tax=Heyndrickxia oleronia TaxID=38875 RepID=UPI0020417CC1|nr:hypothetical protein [Heyndrickxia oleronia]MCM3240746.1 hypothetical protein [Heyndrickxia oleronia]